MRTLIRWSIISLLLALSVVPALAQDTITLKPYTDKTFGLTSVAPDGWKDEGNGLFYRSQSSTDVTVLAEQSVLVTADKVMTSLLPRLGLTTTPESVGTYQSAALNW